jgi:peptidoglycan/xylan/chitin deacetylase (PgdA/CDA1 family)
MTGRPGQDDGGLVALAMRLAHASGATAAASRLQVGYGCLLTFHRVAPSDVWAGLPNRDFHIDAGFLGKLLDYLRQTGWAVVTMDEAVRRIRDGDRSRFVNFSLDDIYRDTAEVAVPVFRSRNVPVTLFVTTGIPDGTLSLWHAGLEQILLERDTVFLVDGTQAPISTAAEKRELYARLSKAWEADGPEAHYSGFCARNGCDPAALRDRDAVSWAMLDALHDDPCVEIGGHTITHPHLSALPESGARDEIMGCKARLEQQLRRPVRHFAFPFGRRGDCSEREFSLTQEAGFVSAATTRKGLAGHSDRDRLQALPRNTLNGSHQQTAQVEMHLSGLSGVVARLRHAT